MLWWFQPFSAMVESAGPAWLRGPQAGCSRWETRGVERWLEEEPGLPGPSPWPSVPGPQSSISSKNRLHECARGAGHCLSGEPPWALSVLSAVLLPGGQDGQGEGLVILS